MLNECVMSVRRICYIWNERMLKALSELVPGSKFQLKLFEAMVLS